MSHLIHTALVIFCFASAAACGSIEEPPPAPTTDPVRTVELDARQAKKADLAAWNLRVDDLQVSIEPRLKATHSRGRIYYKLSGKTSVDLESVQASQSDGLVRSTSLKAPRTFEVALGRDGVEDVLSGQPLFIEFQTVDGAVATARLTIGAGLIAANPARLFLGERMVPIRFGDELRLRGRYQLPEGHELVQVFTDDDAEIVATADGSQGRVDFTADAVMLAADFPDDPVYFDSWDTAETHHRTQATMRIGVETFGLTSADPQEVWPAEPCDDEVEACLGTAERGELDTERCGLAPQVDACSGFVIAPTAADPARFAADLRAHIWTLYANEDAMTREKGAADIRTALERIDASRVHYVGPDAQGMERFDPAHVDVWRHRDPISSGRAGHWYGAYDYGGNLLKLWRR